MDYDAARKALSGGSSGAAPATNTSSTTVSPVVEITPDQQAAAKP